MPRMIPLDEKIGSGEIVRGKMIVSWLSFVDERIGSGENVFWQAYGVSGDTVFS